MIFKLRIAKLRRDTGSKGGDFHSSGHLEGNDTV
jgi:hypothetical protein